MFSRVYRGSRANSAAIHPKVRAIPFNTARRRASFHSGNASRKLNSAVFRILGSSNSSTRTVPAAKPLATARGNTPSSFTNTQTTACWSCSTNLNP